MPDKQPSLKRNAAANYIAQAYVAGIAIIMAPVYLSYMGTEAYGLVGFFTMMAGWFQLLDMGLTPTLARETARHRGGAIGIDALRAFLRTLEVIFGATALCSAVILVALSHPIAMRWLNVHELPLDQAARSIALMGLIVPLRWMSELYRGLINGFERQVWLSGYGILIATLRFVGVLMVFVLFGRSPVYFFSYQLCVAAAELAGLMFMSSKLLHRGTAPRTEFSWKPLMGNITFSLVIAFLTTAWVIVSQADKLILSRMLSLAAYGVFSIAVVGATSITTVSAPLGQALLPRLSKLAAEGNEAGLRRLYDHATQVVCVIATPAVVLLAFFGRQILFAWTGKPALAAQAGPILSLYAVGNGFLALGALAYYIQYAKGNLRLHFIGNVLLLASVVPLFFLGARSYGAVGTGLAWAAVQGVYVLAWVPVIHARVLRASHSPWMLRQVLPIVLPTLAASTVLYFLVRFPSHRLAATFCLLAIGASLLAVAVLCSSVTRTYLLEKLNWCKAAYSTGSS